MRLKWSLGQWRALAARVATQSSDGIEQLHSVPKRGDAKLLQVLVRQARKNRLVYVILAEAASYFPRPRLRSQTTMSMMAPTIGVAHIICRGSEGVQGRLDYGCLRGSQRPLRSYRQWQSLSVIVKIPEWPRNPDFPRVGRPHFLSVCAPVDHSKETRSHVHARGVCYSPSPAAVPQALVAESICAPA